MKRRSVKRFKRLHPIKKRLLELEHDIRASQNNLQEPWVQKYPWLVESQRKKLEKKLKHRKRLSEELLRRKAQLE